MSRRFSATHPRPGSINAPSTAITLAAWVYSESAAGAKYDNDVLYVDAGAGTNKYTGIFLGGGILTFESNNAGTASTVDQSLSNNVWTHVALVNDGTNQISYVNGAQIDSRSFSTSGRSNFNRADFG